MSPALSQFVECCRLVTLITIDSTGKHSSTLDMYAERQGLLVTSGFTEDGSYLKMRVGYSYVQWSHTDISALVHLGLRS